MARQATEYVMDPMIPIITAAQGITEAQPAVIATRPARIPFVRAKKSYLISRCSPVMCFLVTNVKRPEAAGASTVLITARSESLFAPSVIAADEPALKNNHESHRMRVPKAASFGELAVIAIFSSYLV